MEVIKQSHESHISDAEIRLIQDSVKNMDLAPKSKEITQVVKVRKRPDIFEAPMTQNSAVVMKEAGKTKNQF